MRMNVYICRHNVNRKHCFVLGRAVLHVNEVTSFTSQCFSIFGCLFV